MRRIEFFSTTYEEYPHHRGTDPPASRCEALRAAYTERVITMNHMMDINKLTAEVIGAAIEVHKILARPPRLSEPKLRLYYVLHLRIDKQKG